MSGKLTRSNSLENATDLLFWLFLCFLLHREAISGSSVINHPSSMALSLYQMDTRAGFSDSDEIDNVTTAETRSPSPDISSLRRLCGDLESAFRSPEFEIFADARILVSTGQEVAVNRCILAARSRFFRNLFVGRREKGGDFQLSELVKNYDVSFDALMAVLGYLYSGKVGSCPRGVCVCADEDCNHVGCRPAVDFLLEVLYASSTFQVPELVTLYQSRLLEILDDVDVHDVLVVLHVVNMCSSACKRLLARCVETLARSDVDFLTLDKALPQCIGKQIADSRGQYGFHKPESYDIPDKHVKRIHRALDSDDVELVRMLLREAQTTLDDSCALHYAVAYCDAKTTTELLDLGLADVNRRNPRGYTVLHIAAMRKEPKIIVSLLTKGARPSDLTADGRKALQISKRLTKASDYYKSTEEGKACPTDRLCIEILEQAERREPLLGEASLSLAIAGDDLRMKLLYLENRVGLAKLLYPMEAKVIMDIAHLDGTCEFQLDGILHTTNLSGKKRTSVDLNEAPFRIQEEHLIRHRALSRAVELGKHFFPRCSEVLNKIMDTDDLSQLAYVGNDTAEERLLKKTRYVELQEVLARAFDEDKEAFDRSTISSSSSSTSVGVVRRPMVRSPLKYKT